MEKPIIGITTGDLNGIGLELIIKIFSENKLMDYCTPVLFATPKVLNFYRKLINANNFAFHIAKDWEQLSPKQLNVMVCWEEEVNIQPGQLTEDGGKYAIISLKAATEALKSKQIAAIVTAPIHKSNTHTEAFPFTGHTPFFKSEFNADEVLMLLYENNFRVALATEHIPVNEVAQQINESLLNRKLQLLNQTLIRDFGINKPRIAVLGLNPHAGDQGEIGQEEQNIITPTLTKLRDQKGILAFGPYSADAFFAHSMQLKFDGILAMYHDQGLIPFKSLSIGQGVNFTGGLDVVRTSPDHGVAFDIAGKNIADPTSMMEAVFQAIDIVNQRKEYDFYTANPLERSKITKERSN